MVASKYFINSSHLPQVIVELCEDGERFGEGRFLYAARKEEGAVVLGKNCGLSKRRWRIWRRRLHGTGSFILAHDFMDTSNRILSGESLTGDLIFVAYVLCPTFTIRYLQYSSNLAVIGFGRYLTRTIGLTSEQITSNSRFM
jgi:hypothetical protein